MKNRLHVDVKAGGGRQTPWNERWPKVLDMVERLKAAGAMFVRESRRTEGRTTWR